MINDRDELDRMIGELERDEDVALGATALDIAEERRRQLCLEMRERREAIPVSQAKLARRIGTSQPAIARLEAGLADPKLSTVLRYAAALGFELRFNWQPVREPTTAFR
jgi:DNA-binding XRE family transcriptional regulator